MTDSTPTPAEVDADAAIGRRRAALTAMFALVGASVLVLLSDLDVGPAWVHWAGTMVALLAALGMVAVADVRFQIAVTTAKATGLVARSRTP